MNENDCVVMEISKMTLHKDEILVIKLPASWTASMQNDYMKFIINALPDIKFLFGTTDMEMSIIQQESDT